MMTATSRFKVGLIQMRSGLRAAEQSYGGAGGRSTRRNTPAPSMCSTPEMTNILAIKRDDLFAKIVAEDDDPTLAALREAARKLAIYIHIGSLALKTSPDKAANRSLLIDRKGDMLARYDKIHMFDVDLAGGESYRESNSYRRRRTCRRR